MTKLAYFISPSFQTRSLAPGRVYAHTLIVGDSVQDGCLIVGAKYLSIDDGGILIALAGNGVHALLFGGYRINHVYASNLVFAKQLEETFSIGIKFFSKDLRKQWPQLILTASIVIRNCFTAGGVEGSSDQVFNFPSCDVEIVLRNLMRNCFLIV